MASVADRGPPFVGANTQINRADALLTGTSEHVLDWIMNSPVSPAVIATLLITNGAVPQFVIVMLCTVLVVLTPRFPKFNELLLEHTNAAGATPTP